MDEKKAKIINHNWTEEQLDQVLKIIGDDERLRLLAELQEHKIPVKDNWTLHELQQAHFLFLGDQKRNQIASNSESNLNESDSETGSEGDTKSGKGRKKRHMGGFKGLPEDIQKKIIRALKKNEESVHVIAKKYGVNYNTLMKWIREGTVPGTKTN